jgi:Tol biopolymer transport system component/predicted Ser/Thr protein kinase
MSPQQNIAHYRITAKLGEGGMGAVYRATDTKLNREVAIKILPDALAADPDYVARFTREAQILAGLNHPHIAAVYGIEDRAIVMELVEGRELPTPLPLDEALPIARQIAEALEAAHEKGIVHRDLKPANIKLTPDGKVKVLDFGLAKSIEPTGSTTPNSPTLTLRATQAGVIMGTAAYMAPEQARGKVVDKRADIWAFGVVLYEMLTGRQLFGGDTVTDILASVVKDAPDLNALPAGTSPHIRRLLSRCLQKDPSRRLRDIGEARIALDEPAEAPAPPLPAGAPKRAYGWMLAAGFLGIALLGSLLWKREAPNAPLPPLLRFEADPMLRAGIDLALSPDGSRVVYAIPGQNGATQLVARSLDQPSPAPLAGTADGRRPVFSPDGQWIAFAAGGKLYKLNLQQGGAPIALCESPTAAGISWGDDGNIVFAPTIRSPLASVPSSGGTPRPVTAFDSARQEVTHRYPWLMPGGKVVLYTASSRGGAYEDAYLMAADISSGRSTLLRRGGFHPMYVPGPDGRGFLLFFQQDTLYAMPMDPEKLTVREPPAPVLPGVSTSNTSASAAVALSRSGLLAYRPGVNTSIAPLVSIDEQGRTENLRLPPASYASPRVSPDGKRLAYRLATGASGDVWIYDLAAGTSSRLTFSGATGPGEWSFDGKHILYRDAKASSSFWIRSDGSAPAKPLPRDIGGVVAFTPDGRRSISVRTSEGGRNELIVIPWEDPAADDPKPGQAETWMTTDRSSFAALSPDGKWVAYTSDETGRTEVFVRSFPGPGGKWQVSTGGGTYSAWSPDGKELFFCALGGALRAVTYTVRGEAFVRGSERAVFTGRVSGNFGVRNYSPVPGTKRIIAILDPDETDEKNPARRTCLVNFTAELERRLGHDLK